MLSYSLAHDLRQPLITISGYSHRLRDSVQTGIEKHYVERIVESIDEVNIRADSLLYFANLFRSPLQCVAMDLGRLAHSELSRLQRQQPSRQLLSTVHPNLSIWADPNLMTQALHELIFNAWKFTSNRPISMIEVGTVIGEQGELTVFVRDNGVGFNMAYVNTLLEPFQRIESIPGSAGRGLGLTKVRSILTKHGGRLWATSEIDVGSTFYFSLPSSSSASESSSLS